MDLRDLKAHLAAANIKTEQQDKTVLRKDFRCAVLSENGTYRKGYRCVWRVLLRLDVLSQVLARGRLRQVRAIPLL